MCDYSLQNVASRPAVVGDTLVTHNFGTGTRGFASPECLDCAGRRRQGLRRVVRRPVHLGASPNLSHINASPAASPQPWSCAPRAYVPQFVSRFASYKEAKLRSKRGK